ncbi:MAG: hypothetical protein OXC62_08180 [Aestuariivita sp.]|nr:hypothetical protein [Aestuariivita sp.]
MEPTATGVPLASHHIQQPLFDPTVGAGHPSGVQGALHGTPGTLQPVRDLRRPHTVCRRL